MQETGNNHNKSTKRLSIRLYPDGFSLWDNNSFQQIRLNQTESSLFSKSEPAIIHLLNEMPELTSQQNQLQIIFETPYYSFIPNALYQESRAKEILYFQYDEIPENWVTVSQSIEKSDLTLVYALPAAISNACQQLYPEAAKSHHLGYFMHYMQNNTENTVHLWIRQQFTDIVWIKNNQPVLINSFHTRTTEDLIYFLFKTAETFEQNSDVLSLHLYQEEKTILPESLKKYFPSVTSHNKTMQS